MAAPNFQNDDEAAQYYLSTLRDGTRADKIVARDGLAAIFGRRGLYEQAAELYELNIRAGVRTSEVFEALGAVYQKLGDDESARAAFAEADRWRPEKSPPPTSTDSGRTIVASTHPPIRPAAHASRPDEQLPVPPVPDEPRLVTFSRPAVRDARPPAVAAETPPVGTGGHVGGMVRAPMRGSAAPALAHEPVPDPSVEITERLPVCPLPDERKRPSGRLSRVPGPLQVVGIVVLLIAVPVLLLAVLVVNPVALYLEGRAAGPTIDAELPGLAQVKIAPGTGSAWYLDVGRSVSGLWATPGLELKLDQESAGLARSHEVTAPRPQGWGETITIVERRGQGRTNQPTLIPARFDAPSELPPTGTVLTGHVLGQVTAPRLSENSQFNTASQSVDVPIRLVVVSMPELLFDRFSHAVAMYFDGDRWLLVTIGALLTWCVLAGGAAIWFRIGHR